MKANIILSTDNLDVCESALESLSVQELIDCDTKFNRGCNGGNPMYAYEYVIKRGIADAADYSYTGQVFAEI